MSKKLSPVKRMVISVISVTLFLVVAVRGRAVDRSNATNEIDHGSSKDHKNPLGSSRDVRWKTTLSTAGESSIGARQIDSVNPITDSATITEPTEDTPNNEGNSTPKNNVLSWILSPLANRIQFSPQNFLKDRLNEIKESLNHLGVNVQQQNTSAKQFGGIGGLLQLSGLNDSGFYTNRLDSAGFLGGNGWLANKGGILGGPGVILSTGSLLTDYPSSYKK